MIVTEAGFQIIYSGSVWLHLRFRDFTGERDESMWTTGRNETKSPFLLSNYYPHYPDRV